MKRKRVVKKKVRKQKQLVMHTPSWYAHVDRLDMIENRAKEKDDDFRL